jgi:ABC-type transporter Mla maintaining outer membrane lipid asymmetry permease subunit MlaE
MNTTEAVETVAETVAETTEVLAESAFSFNPANFVSNLYYMGVGMLAIFIVIAAIIGMVYALDVLVKAFSLKLPKKQ